VNANPHLDLERVARRLVERLFSGKAQLSMEFVRDAQGGQRLRCAWKAGGWTGTLELGRAGEREFSGKELAGIMSLLEQMERERP
jgi:hypothetical protein